MTLKFLGDVVDRDIPQVCKAIRESCQNVTPFELEFAGTGGFPDDERPRIVWAGIVSGGEFLVELVTGLEAQLAKLGFKPEPRDYRPHLTLGRTRSGSRSASPDVIEKIKRFKRRRLGILPVEEVRLYASFLDKEGTTYNVMDKVPLGADEVNFDEEFEVDEDLHQQ